LLAATRRDTESDNNNRNEAPTGAPGCIHVNDLQYALDCLADRSVADP